MAFCSNCGSQLTDGADKCINCGASAAVNTLPTAATVPATEQPAVVNRAPKDSGDISGRAMAIVSFVCGIVGTVTFSGITLGILALIFGIISRKEGNKSGMSTAGIVLGSVSLVTYVLLIALYILLIAAYIILLVFSIGVIGAEGMYY